MNHTLRDISTWDEAYVLNLPTSEFDWLEFKASQWLDCSDKCLRKLSEYVSAFANFDGGYLVIGVTNPSVGRPLTLDQGIALDIRRDLKKWLEDVIPNLVDPKISKLGIALIPRPDSGSTAISRAMAVIHIPQSDHAPHQASDRKYYTRVGSSLSALGHQAVMDIVGRKRNPIIKTEIFINFNRTREKNNLFWRVTNLSPVFVRHVCTRMHVPINAAGSHIAFKDMTMRVLDDGKTLVWPIVAANALAIPLFPYGTIARTYKIEQQGGATPHPTPDRIWFKTFADEMMPIEGTIPLSDAVNLTRGKAERSPPLYGSPAAVSPSGEA